MPWRFAKNVIYNIWALLAPRTSLSEFVETNNVYEAAIAPDVSAQFCQFFQDCVNLNKSSFTRKARLRPQTVTDPDSRPIFVTMSEQQILNFACLAH